MIEHTLQTAPKVEPAAQINVLIEDLIARAVAHTASDIHLTAGVVPTLRINGTLVKLDDLQTLTPEETESLARQMTNETQWNKFVDDKELDFSLSRRRAVRFRVNIYWQRGSVGIAMRAIPHDVPSFNELGLPEVLKKFAMADHGLFIVTGPTGSGKSTTLAAMIGYINKNKSCHIVTIEDPIEYLHRHDKSIVNQREMYSDTHSFHEALRHVLRQDPDVILLGEMRDLDTIGTALILAETGHLVLATLHTGDSSQALTRIIDVYPPHQQGQARTQLSMVLVGIMAQQLIRKKDGSGRVLAHELLTATPAIAHMIRTSEIHQVYSAIETGSTDGMCTLNNSLLKLHRAGVISRDEALQKTVRQKELLSRLHGSR